jgi:hypothetical protein
LPILLRQRSRHAGPNNKAECIDHV